MSISIQKKIRDRVWDTWTEVEGPISGCTFFTFRRHGGDTATIQFKVRGLVMKKAETICSPNELRMLIFKHQFTYEFKK